MCSTLIFYFHYTPDERCADPLVCRGENQYISACTAPRGLSLK